MRPVEPLPGVVPAAVEAESVPVETTTPTASGPDGPQTSEGARRRRRRRRGRRSGMGPGDGQQTSAGQRPEPSSPVDETPAEAAAPMEQLPETGIIEHPPVPFEHVASAPFAHPVPVPFESPAPVPIEPPVQPPIEPVSVAAPAPEPSPAPAAVPESHDAPEPPRPAADPDRHEVLTPAMNLAIVVQRYGADISGGAELHARYIAERLSSRVQVRVLTTCARDYISPGATSFRRARTRSMGFRSSAFA